MSSAPSPRVFAAVLSLLALAPTSTANAQSQAKHAPESRRFGDCWAWGCLGPSLNIGLGGWNFDTKQGFLGFAPGAAYGVTFWPDHPWSNVGIHAGVSAVQENLTGTDERPVVVTPSIIFSVAEYVRVGIALRNVSKSSKTDAFTDTLLLFGVGADLGKTPSSEDTTGTQTPEDSEEAIDAILRVGETWEWHWEGGQWYTIAVFSRDDQHELTFKATTWFCTEPVHDCREQPRAFEWTSQPNIKASPQFVKFRATKEDLVDDSSRGAQRGLRGTVEIELHSDGRNLRGKWWGVSGAGSTTPGNMILVPDKW